MNIYTNILFFFIGFIILQWGFDFDVMGNIYWLAPLGIVTLLLLDTAINFFRSFYLKKSKKSTSNIKTANFSYAYKVDCDEKLLDSIHNELVEICYFHYIGNNIKKVQEFVPLKVKYPSLYWILMTFGIAYLLLLVLLLYLDPKVIIVWISVLMFGYIVLSELTGKFKIKHQKPSKYPRYKNFYSAYNKRVLKKAHSALPYTADYQFTNEKVTNYRVKEEDKLFGYENIIDETNFAIIGQCVTVIFKTEKSFYPYLILFQKSQDDTLPVLGHHNIPFIEYNETQMDRVIAWESEVYGSL